MSTGFPRGPAGGLQLLSQLTAGGQVAAAERALGERESGEGEVR